MIISFDTETYYRKKTPDDPGYSVADLGNWAYTHHPEFDCYLISVHDGEDTWAGHPTEFDWSALEGHTLVSHNKGFDKAVLDRLVELGIAPKLNLTGWYCTADLSAYVCNRRSLKAAAGYLLGVKASKTERDWMNGKTWEDAVEAGKSEALLEYAKADAVNCWRLWNEHSDKWPEHERQLSNANIEECARGVAINVELLEKYLELAGVALQATEDTMPWVAAGEKPTSLKVIATYCTELGIPCPPVISKEGEAAYTKWEDLFGDKYPWVRSVSNWRVINKVKSQLEIIQKRLREDNTIDFSLLYFGGHTGRFSGSFGRDDRWSGGGFNMQNIRKDPVHIDSDGLLTYDPEKSAGSISMRQLFIPRPGKKFIIADASQIEPRVLHWLAGNFELLDLIREGFSYYEAYAKKFKGWQGKPGTIKKELGGKGYTLLKNECLGLGYGMGAKKFTTYAGVDAATAQEVVAGFRANNPRITRLWRALDRALHQQVGKDWAIELPSGREMRYEKISKEKEQELTIGGELQALVSYKVGIGGSRYFFWGGDLTENVVQATARDVFCHHQALLRAAGFKIVWHVHDEVIIEADKDADQEDVVKIMSTPPDWMPEIPLAVEAQTASYYQK